MEAKEEKIRVAVRVRPLSDSGSLSFQKEAITSSPDGQHVLVYGDASRTSVASFRCGTFLPTEITQHDVFDEIRAPELVEAALDGFPVTIFAYGQTGAGKSFTIFGKEDVSASGAGKGYGGGVVGETDGILPRAAMRLMEVADERRDMFEYTLRVTCVEIYNEQVRDLFDAKKESLPVRHSKDHGFYLENATVVQCKTAKEIIRVVKLAATNRIKSAHLLNERSNRSHCLVTIYIDSTPRDPEMGAKKYGKLTIVDLAGSERANDTGAVGQQLKETGHINKSLYCLSKVIHAMTANNKAGASGKSKFVPYRDSKLTMLLIDSLGGNSKTLMIACVNSAPQFAVESTRTLEFAMGVAKIKNRPTAVLNPHEKLIIDLKEEIRLLKLENMMLRSRTPGYFMEHPETIEGIEGFEGYAQEMATSPLGRALLSGRHRPEDVKAMQQARLRSYGDNNNEFDNEAAKATLVATVRRARTSEREAMGAGLSGIKKMAAQRRSENASKKSKNANQKAKKKKKKATPEATSYAAQPFPGGFALPPVRQNVTLFHKRSPGVSLVGDNSFNRAPAPVQRPASSPPEYDDLFGIETVSVGASPLGDNQDQHTTAKRSSASLAALEPTTTPPLNPSDQIQKLLRDMLAPPQPNAPRNSLKAPAPELKPRMSGSGMSLVGPASALALPQFDDARTADLFQQLCRL